MANQTGKIVAGAIVALVNGEPVFAAPKFANTCYSFVDDKQAVNVAGVFAYDPEKKAMVGIKESSGVSAAPSEIEGGYAQAWANNIWNVVLKSGAPVPDATRPPAGLRLSGPCALWTRVRDS
jgi:hypothetical protein